MNNKLVQLREDILNFSSGRSHLLKKSQNYERFTVSRKLLNSDFFKESKLFSKIMKITQFLTDYGIKHNIEIDIILRLKAIFSDEELIVPKCPICKTRDCRLKMHVNFGQSIFGELCSDKSCTGKYMSYSRGPTRSKTRSLMSQSAVKAKRNTLEEFISIFKAKDNVNVEVMKNSCILFCKKHVAEQKHITIEEIHAVPEIIQAIFAMTDFICSPQSDVITSKADLHLDERMYCIANQISERVKCSFCNKNYVKFISLRRGYSDVCSNALCISDKIKTTNGQITSAQTIAEIEKSGDYTVIEFPQVLDRDVLKVRCNKCGKISEMIMHTGMSQHVDEMKLCKFCDRYQSREERELRECLASSLDDNNMDICNRLLISPYELDILFPDKMLAVEYDGFYWHNADVVKSYYHRHKTDLCAKKGVDLVHVFENEWLFSKDAIIDQFVRQYNSKSLIHLNSEDCVIKKVQHEQAKLFVNENSICDLVLDIGKINYGITYKGELIQLLSFDKVNSPIYDFKIVVSCSKIGTIIDNGFHLLMSAFEKDYKPMNIIVNVNSRWPILRYEFINEGFCILNKKPQIRALFYSMAYAKNNYNLLNKKQLISKLGDSYDKNKTIHENASLIKYKCIYDCGSIMLMKNY